jgi:hypothetical protein
VLLAKVLDVFSGSSGLLLPSSSSSESGARVQAGASEVCVYVPVSVVVVSKPAGPGEHTLSVASMAVRQYDDSIVDDVRTPEDMAEMLKPSVHHTRRSVTVVRWISSQDSG